MLLGVILGLLGGGLATFSIQKVMLKSKSEKLIKDAEVEAENIKKEKTRIITDNKYFSTYTNIMNLSSNNIKISKIQPHTKMINEEGLYLLLNKSTKSFAKNIIEKFYTET